jgi:glutaminyl-tRNA synthetase
MRDPVMYRILYTHHHRTGDKWCIYPTYDWAHGQSDSIEGITHSLCSLEFENHRPLYEWFIEKLGIFPSRQIEFARLHMTYTMMSKRKLRRLVEEGLVEGWDDPRMPTIQALRRRGYRREAIHAFIERVGVAKTNSVIDYALLEHTVREDLDPIVPRVMAVLHPLKLVIENFPADQVEEFDVDYYRHDNDKHETRKVPLTREVYIERDDFMIDPPKKFFRLAPGREVRLMNACLVTCTDYKVDEETGEVNEVICTYDPESLGGQAPDGRRVKGTLHWVSAAKAIDGEVRIYDKLFTVEAPDDTEEGEDFTDFLNHDSLETITDAKLESSLADAEPGSRFQFMRQGFYYIDPVATEMEGHPIYNQTVALRDSWAKIQAKQKK